MTDEELLLKDLCARLPYVTYYDLSYYGHETRAVVQGFSPSTDPLQSLVKVNTIVGFIPYENIKPYLRPLPTMTEEEKKEIQLLKLDLEASSTDVVPKLSRIMFWYYEHHFDLNGLIPRGLAIEASEGMYNT